MKAVPLDEAVAHLKERENLQKKTCSPTHFLALCLAMEFFHTSAVTSLTL